ncbi:MAG: glutamine amidotransferase [Candidatus Dormibacteraeota bacterium]|nr:glutamine amidotransferase [Candidatus Dormibacteraeota bacterium]
MRAPLVDAPPLRIAHLYPALLNVAGDGGNVRAIQRRCAWRGLQTEVVDVGLGEAPDFTAFDLILFHGGQDVEMGVVAQDLEAKAAALREAAASGVVFFAVCAGLQLLGHRYIPQSGPVMEGVGLLDLETRGADVRFMQHAACEVRLDGRQETVVGFENHSGLTELGPSCEPFGRVTAGSGNNGRDGTEGARSGHVYATYLHGPVLPKNPILADHLIRSCLERRAGGPIELAPLDDGVEHANHDVALRKAIENRGRRTALEPARLVRDRARQAAE